MARPVRIPAEQEGFEKSVMAAVNRLNRSGQLKLNVNSKSFTQPLGKIRASADEFTKSLEASNARVIAFGASVGIINAVGQAFKSLVMQTIEVELKMKEISVIMKGSSKDMIEMQQGLFGVAKDTAQSFGLVTEAALEFSRQGMTMAKTLEATQQAMILARITALDATEAVKGLTAAVNGFADAGITHAEVVNKMSAVDVAFAVSTEDLIHGLERAGAVAQGAKVNFDELMGAITAAQQITARGGNVIGNSFKTIFTRIQRRSTINRLEELGIAVKDMQGRTLPAMKVLKELAMTYDTLTDSTKAAVAEQVGGVFQINILRAALKDLSKENSVFARATSISSRATDEATRKNIALNQTLSALASQTGTSIQQLTEAMGKLTMGPGIEKVLKTINTLAEGIFSGIEAEGIGGDLARGMLKGVGNILSGPGLILIGGMFVKLFGEVTRFAAKSTMNIIGITSQKQKQKVVEDAILKVLMEHEGVEASLLAMGTNRIAQEKHLLTLIKQQAAATKERAAIAAAVAPGIVRAGVKGPNLSVGNKGAGGVIPKADRAIERRGALAGGYSPGGVSRINIKGVGPVVYNKAEKVKKFPGMQQEAIMPPHTSKAGSRYSREFKKVHGFDPYAQSGFVPNYGIVSTPRGRAMGLPRTNMVAHGQGTGQNTQRMSQKYSTSGDKMLSVDTSRFVNRDVAYEKRNVLGKIMSRLIDKNIVQLVRPGRFQKEGQFRMTGGDPDHVQFERHMINQLSSQGYRSTGRVIDSKTRRLVEPGNNNYPQDAFAKGKIPREFKISRIDEKDLLSKSIRRTTDLDPAEILAGKYTTGDVTKGNDFVQTLRHNFGPSSGTPDEVLMGLVEKFNNSNLKAAVNMLRQKGIEVPQGQEAYTAAIHGLSKGFVPNFTGGGLGVMMKGWIKKAHATMSVYKGGKGLGGGEGLSAKTLASKDVELGLMDELSREWGVGDNYGTVMKTFGRIHERGSPNSVNQRVLDIMENPSGLAGGKPYSMEIDGKNVLLKDLWSSREGRSATKFLGQKGKLGDIDRARRGAISQNEGRAHEAATHKYLQKKYGEEATVKVPGTSSPTDFMVKGRGYIDPITGVTQKGHGPAHVHHKVLRQLAKDNPELLQKMLLTGGKFDGIKALAQTANPFMGEIPTGSGLSSNTFGFKEIVGSKGREGVSSFAAMKDKSRRAFSGNPPKFTGGIGSNTKYWKAMQKWYKGLNAKDQLKVKNAEMTGEWSVERMASQGLIPNFNAQHTMAKQLASQRAENANKYVGAERGQFNVLRDKSGKITSKYTRGLDYPNNPEWTLRNPLLKAKNSGQFIKEIENFLNMHTSGRLSGGYSQGMKSHTVQNRLGQDVSIVRDARQGFGEASYADPLLTEQRMSSGSGMQKQHYGSGAVSWGRLTDRWGDRTGASGRTEGFAKGSFAQGGLDLRHGLLNKGVVRVDSKEFDAYNPTRAQEEATGLIFEKQFAKKDLWTKNKLTEFFRTGDPSLVGLPPGPGGIRPMAQGQSPLNWLQEQIRGGQLEQVVLDSMGGFGIGLKKEFELTQASLRRFKPGGRDPNKPGSSGGLIPNFAFGMQGGRGFSAGGKKSIQAANAANRTKALKGQDMRMFNMEYPHPSIANARTERVNYAATLKEGSMGFSSFAKKALDQKNMDIARGLRGQAKRGLISAESKDNLIEDLYNWEKMLKIDQSVKGQSGRLKNLDRSLTGRSDLSANLDDLTLRNQWGKFIKDTRYMDMDVKIAENYLRRYGGKEVGSKASYEKGMTELHGVKGESPWMVNTFDSKFGVKGGLSLRNAAGGMIPNFAMVKGFPSSKDYSTKWQPAVAAANRKQEYIKYLIEARTKARIRYDQTGRPSDRNAADWKSAEILALRKPGSDHMSMSHEKMFGARTRQAGPPPRELLVASGGFMPNFASVKPVVGGGGTPFKLPEGFSFTKARKKTLLEKIIQNAPDKQKIIDALQKIPFDKIDDVMELIPMLKKLGINVAEALPPFLNLFPGGLVPNFADPLGAAISREKAAGVPASLIRVSQSNRLKGPQNPAGLAVTNTRDEPSGVGQGIRRAISMGIDPKTHGASRGLVPGFALPTHPDGPVTPSGPGAAAAQTTRANTGIQSFSQQITALGHKLGKFGLTDLNKVSASFNKFITSANKNSADLGKHSAALTKDLRALGMEEAEIRRVTGALSQLGIAAKKAGSGKQVTGGGVTTAGTGVAGAPGAGGASPTLGQRVGGLARRIPILGGMHEGMNGQISTRTGSGLGRAIGGVHQKIAGNPGMQMGMMMAPMMTEMAAEAMRGGKPKWKRSQGERVAAGTVSGLGDIAMYTAMGSMFGPWGTAIGAAVGATIALTKVFKEADLSLQDVQERNQSYAAEMDTVHKSIQTYDKTRGAIEKARQQGDYRTAGRLENRLSKSRLDMSRSFGQEFASQYTRADDDEKRAMIDKAALGKRALSDIQSAEELLKGASSGENDLAGFTAETVRRTARGDTSKSGQSFWEFYGMDWGVEENSMERQQAYDRTRGVMRKSGESMGGLRGALTEEGQQIFDKFFNDARWDKIDADAGGKFDAGIAADLTKEMGDLMRESSSHIDPAIAGENRAILVKQLNAFAKETGTNWHGDTDDQIQAMLKDVHTGVKLATDGDVSVRQDHLKFMRNELGRFAKNYKYLLKDILFEFESANSWFAGQRKAQEQFHSQMSGQALPISAQATARMTSGFEETKLTEDYKFKMRKQEQDEWKKTSLQLTKTPFTQMMEQGTKGSRIFEGDSPASELIKQFITTKHAGAPTTDDIQAMFSGAVGSGSAGFSKQAPEASQAFQTFLKNSSMNFGKMILDHQKVANEQISKANKNWQSMTHSPDDAIAKSKYGNAILKGNSLSGQGAYDIQKAMYGGSGAAGGSLNMGDDVFTGWTKWVELHNKQWVDPDVRQKRTLGKVDNEEYYGVTDTGTWSHAASGRGGSLGMQPWEIMEAGMKSMQKRIMAGNLNSNEFAEEMNRLRKTKISETITTQIDSGNWGPRSKKGDDTFKENERTFKTEITTFLSQTRLTKIDEWQAQMDSYISSMGKKESASLLLKASLSVGGVDDLMKELNRQIRGSKQGAAKDFLMRVKDSARAASLSKSVHEMEMAIFKQRKEFAEEAAKIQQDTMNQIRSANDKLNTITMIASPSFQNTGLLRDQRDLSSKTQRDRTLENVLSEIKSSRESELGKKLATANDLEAFNKKRFPEQELAQAKITAQDLVKTVTPDSLAANLPKMSSLSYNETVAQNSRELDQAQSNEDLNAAALRRELMEDKRKMVINKGLQGEKTIGVGDGINPGTGINVLRDRIRAAQHAYQPGGGEDEFRLRSTTLSSFNLMEQAGSQVKRLTDTLAGGKAVTPAQTKIYTDMLAHHSKRQSVFMAEQEAAFKGLKVSMDGVSLIDQSDSKGAEKAKGGMADARKLFTEKLIDAWQKSFSDETVSGDTRAKLDKTIQSLPPMVQDAVRRLDSNYRDIKASITDQKTGDFDPKELKERVNELFQKGSKGLADLLEQRAKAIKDGENNREKIVLDTIKIEEGLSARAELNKAILSAVDPMKKSAAAFSSLLGFISELMSHRFTGDMGTAGMSEDERAQRGRRSETAIMRVSNLRNRVQNNQGFLEQAMNSAAAKVGPSGKASIENFGKTLSLKDLQSSDDLEKTLNALRAKAKVAMKEATPQDARTIASGLKVTDEFGQMDGAKKDSALEGSGRLAELDAQFQKMISTSRLAEEQDQRKIKQSKEMNRVLEESSRYLRSFGAGVSSAMSDIRTRIETRESREGSTLVNAFNEGIKNNITDGWDEGESFWSNMNNSRRDARSQDAADQATNIVFGKGLGDLFGAFGWEAGSKFDMGKLWDPEGYKAREEASGALNTMFGGEGGRGGQLDVTDLRSDLLADTDILRITADRNAETAVNTYGILQAVQSWQGGPPEGDGLTGPTGDVSFGGAAGSGAAGITEGDHAVINNAQNLSQTEIAAAEKLAQVKNVEDASQTERLFSGLGSAFQQLASGGRNFEAGKWGTTLKNGWDGAKKTTTSFIDWWNTDDAEDAEKFRGGLISKFNSGGKVAPFGGNQTTDNVPALLTGGEFVMRKDAVDTYGRDFMERLNQGKAPGLILGGDPPEDNSPGFWKKVGTKISGGYQSAKERFRPNTGAGEVGFSGKGGFNKDAQTGSYWTKSTGQVALNAEGTGPATTKDSFGNDVVALNADGTGPAEMTSTNWANVGNAAVAGLDMIGQVATANADRKAAKKKRQDELNKQKAEEDLRRRERDYELLRPMEYYDMAADEIDLGGVGGGQTVQGLAGMKLSARAMLGHNMPDSGHYSALLYSTQSSHHRNKISDRLYDIEYAKKKAYYAAVDKYEKKMFIAESLVQVGGSIASMAGAGEFMKVANKVKSISGGVQALAGYTDNTNKKPAKWSSRGAPDEPEKDVSGPQFNINQYKNRDRMYSRYSTIKSGAGSAADMWMGGFELTAPGERDYNPALYGKAKKKEGRYLGGLIQLGSGGSTDDASRITRSSHPDISGGDRAGRALTGRDRKGKDLYKSFAGGGMIPPLKMKDLNVAHDLVDRINTEKFAKINLDDFEVQEIDDAFKLPDSVLNSINPNGRGIFNPAIMASMARGFDHLSAKKQGGGEIGGDSQGLFSMALGGMIGVAKGITSSVMRLATGGGVGKSPLDFKIKPDLGSGVTGHMIRSYEGAMPHGGATALFSQLDSNIKTQGLQRKNEMGVRKPLRASHVLNEKALGGLVGLQSLGKYSLGGNVTGGSGVRDDVPALLSDGEYVIKKSSAQRYGTNLLDQINAGNKRIKRFQDGGSTGGDSGVTVEGGGNQEVTHNVSQNFTFNISKDGTTSEKEEDDDKMSDNEREKEFGRRVRMACLKVIEEERRIGGLLH